MHPLTATGRALATRASRAIPRALACGSALRKASTINIEIVDWLEVQSQLTGLDPGQIEKLMNDLAQLFDANERRGDKLALTLGNQLSALSCNISSVIRSVVNGVCSSWDATANELRTHLIEPHKVGDVVEQEHGTALWGRVEQERVRRVAAAAARRRREQREWYSVKSAEATITGAGVPMAGRDRRAIEALDAEVVEATVGVLNASGGEKR